MFLHNLEKLKHYKNQVHFLPEQIHFEERYHNNIVNILYGYLITVMGEKLT